jgi:hypothetical protein
MNYMDTSYPAITPTRGVGVVSSATRMSSQRDIPHDPGHPQRSSTQSACMAMPLDDRRQDSVQSAKGRLAGAKIGREDVDSDFRPGLYGFAVMRAAPAAPAEDFSSAVSSTISTASPSSR